MFEHILVPLDGSERSERAIPYAAELASPDTRITLLSILEMPMTPFYISPAPPALPQETEDYEQARTQKTEAAQQYLYRMAQSLQDHPGKVEISTVVDTDPAEQIIKYVDEYQVDSIVICTRGHSGIARWVMGSITQKILQAAPCPVLVIPTE